MALADGVPSMIRRDALKRGIDTDIHKLQRLTARVFEVH